MNRHRSPEELSEIYIYAMGRWVADYSEFWQVISVAATQAFCESVVFARSQEGVNSFTQDEDGGV